MRKSCQKHSLWKWWETCQKPWSTPRPRCKRKGDLNYTEVWSLWTLPHVNTSLCIVLAQTTGIETRQIEQIYWTQERTFRATSRNLIKQNSLYQQHMGSLNNGLGGFFFLLEDNCESPKAVNSYDQSLRKKIIIRTEFDFKSESTSKVYIKSCVYGSDGTSV